MKNNLVLVIFAILTYSIYFTGCSENEPVTPEGSSKLILHAYWQEGDSTYKMQNAEVLLVSSYGTFKEQTNSEGILEKEGLPSAIYNISIQMKHPQNDLIVITGTLKNIEIKNNSETVDSIYGTPTSTGGIVINELYFVGPVNSNNFLFDQYIELYNASDSTKYLDGMMILKLSSSSNSGSKPGSDFDLDGDIDGVLHAYKFPGNPGEKNIRFLPKTFLVLASSANDYSAIHSTSIDLTGSDWEFFNQYSTDDTDNPNAKNLINLRSDTNSDFLMRSDNDIIAITSGVDTVWNDGINKSDFIDGVEYQNATNSKTMDADLDQSYVVSPARYSGQSVQRISHGYDTNNSIVDFKIFNAPTPGY